MRKFLFILLLLPLFAFPQAEKPYRSIIIDSVKALTGGIIDVKDTLKQDVGIKFNDGTFQSTAGISGNTIYSGDDNLAGNRTVTMGANAMTFSGNLTTFKGIDATSANFGLSVEDNVTTKLFRVRNDGNVGISAVTSFDQALTVIATNTATSNMAEFKRTDAGTGHIKFLSGSGTELFPIIEGKNEESTGRGLRISGIVGSDVQTVNQAAIELHSPNPINANLFAIFQGTSALHVIEGGSFNRMGWNARNGLNDILAQRQPDEAFEFLAKENDKFTIANITSGGGFRSSPDLVLRGKFGAGPTDFDVRLVAVMGSTTPTGFLFTTVNGVFGTVLDQSGNFGIGTTLFGTSAAKVLGILNGTAPTTSPADIFQMYSADISASAVPHFRTEAGDIIKLFKTATGYTTFTNLVTDRTADADATSVAELADILGTLIEDLKTSGLIAP